MFKIPINDSTHLIDVSTTVEEKISIISGSRERQSRHTLVPRDLIKMDDGEDLKEVDREITSTGTVSHKYQEFYNGIPIYGSFATIETDRITRAYTGQADGHVLTHIKSDVKSIVPRMSEKEVLIISKQDTLRKHPGCKIDREETKLFIFLTGNGTAVLAYKVSFRFTIQHLFGRPGYFVDSFTGKILKTFSEMKSFQLKSTGGNAKAGKHKYGVDMPYLLVERHGDYCTLRNDYVSVYHMHNSEEEPTVPYTFNCTSGIHDATNGGYSPLSDVFYYSTEVFLMFKKWINLYPINDLPLKMYVHHGVNDSAHYDPNINAVIIGDGIPQYAHPYAALDVVGHEIGHAFSDIFPKLEYDNQSGGLCESLADIIGEASEWYVYHRVDSFSGKDIYVHYDGRKLCHQDTDGRSIINVHDFEEGMNVHYASGVFNRFACELSATLTWKDIFRIFTYAGRFYWCETTDFVEGGCGVLKAAYDLGYDLGPFEIGLRNIGLVPCSIESHIRLISEYTEIKDLTVDSKNRGILFKVDFRKLNKDINDNVKMVQILTSGGSGDVDLLVGFGAHVSKDDALYMSALTGNAEILYIEQFFVVKILYLKLIPKHSHFTGVTLIANAL